MTWQEVRVQNLEMGGFVGKFQFPPPFSSSTTSFLSRSGSGSYLCAHCSIELSPSDSYQNLSQLLPSPDKRKRFFSPSLSLSFISTTNLTLLLHQTLPPRDLIVGMPRLVPVVEIDNRKRVSVPPQSNGIRRDQQSSSPIFISSNNVATSSNSKFNGLSGSGSSSGTLRAPIVEIKANTSRVVSVNKGLTNGVTPAKVITSRSKDKTENELVLPPAGEPRLKSVFDTSWAGSCVWSPSHRVARVSSAYCHHDHSHES